MLAPADDDMLIDGADEQDGQPIDAILAMVEAVGPDGLTEDESSALNRYQQAKGDKSDHYANLAEHLKDRHLLKIAQDVVRWVEWDEEARQDWSDREVMGIQALGISEKTYGGADFKGASRVTHPLLMEACAQFAARAIAELWPATGPVRTAVLGKPDEDKLAQAQRVESYMNYQYTALMPSAFEEEDRLLFRLPLSGSVFKKVAYDPLEKQVVSTMVEPSDFIVPYSATDLRTAVRYTHRQFEEPAVVKRKMATGLYRDSDYPLTRVNENLDYPAVREEIESVEGRQRVSVAIDDDRHTTLECYCRLDIPGFESDDGIPLPYIITVDRDTLHVHAIRRNWHEDDGDRKPRQHFVHKRFLPGLGFYGLGFLHAIGSLSDAATGALRALLDAANFANLPAGYRSRDSRIPGGTKTPGPGDWIEVDSTAEELAKAFYPLPYKEPSKTLLELLGVLTDAGQRFASTTEAMVGESNNTGPVGTTLALIEQGSKIFSAIHKRLHQANSQEFRLVHDLNHEWMPERYPYAIEGDDAFTLREDFDGRVDVLPVSDPNIVSNVQRIAQAQAVLQLSQQAPDLYDRKLVHKTLLEALRVADIDALMPDIDDVPRREPIEENMALLLGKPIKVYPDQEHQAHILVHQQWFAGLPPEYQQMLQAAHMAHVGEHLAWTYRLQMQQAMGLALPPPLTLDQTSAEREADEQPELPPEMDYQISVMAAQSAQVMQAQQQALQAMQAQQALQAEAQGQAMQADQQAQRDRMDITLAAQQQEREQARKDSEAQAKQAREDAKARADIMRQDAMARAEIAARAQHSPGERIQAESDRLVKGKEYQG